ncbi:hypothetical protein OF897_21295 [Chryseobacterium formosus]|uniref:DUF6603 domain-containing protein n=1 Tax=Chryseobacterium formosus TaxID=1537363 RepID=A0ABT3XXR0_9FLAO|nr:DUF6603 domain-containing protein [Chryseobacterium formosus]MCX8526457.1 hypothetical protein [Chryseobacterium formosus]
MITLDDDISVTSLIGNLPDVSKNISKLLEDEDHIQETITPFIPSEVGFGIYKISNEKDNLSALQLQAKYSKLKLKGFFSNEFKLFSVAIAEGISLSKMPLVGEYLKDYSISTIELVYVSQKEKIFTNERLKLIDGAKKNFVDSTIWLNKEKLSLSKGFNAGMILKNGNDQQKITFPGFDLNGIKVPGLPVYSDSTKKNNKSTSDIIQKEEAKQQSLVKINEVKPSIENHHINIAISADFNVGPFGLQLVGLGIQVPFSVFQNFSIEKLWKEVQFHLNGLAIIYDTPTLSIAGAFLRERNNGTDEYNGLLTFRFAKIEVIAIGSYIKTPSYSSLFAFGYLGIPLPIDPSFYIHGFALGFGLNRDFVMPNITEIPDFPLIKIVDQGGLKPEDNIQKIFHDLNRYLPTSENSYVMIAGIKFDSYKMIFTTGILALAFGNKTSLNLLGLSKMKLEGVYNFEFAFSMRADLEEGTFLAHGQLTNNSYVLLPQLKLTGGFALGMWLKGEMAGDFVFTLGGYHPNFKAPVYYPNNIPRLGYSFNLGSVQFYGKAYFALTPSCIMAGMAGGLKLVLDGRVLHAEIGVLFSADFIISWKPFYYQAEVYVQIYAKVILDVWLFSINQSFNLTAKLQLEGPNFRGIATFKVVGYELEVKFGDHDKHINKSLSKEEFVSAFLPDPAKILTYNISSGIIKKVKDTHGVECVVVNPKTFALEIYSEIPITEINGEQLITENKNTQNIYPVYTESIQLNSKLILSVKGNGNHFSCFKASPILKSVPTSIWNNTNAISDNDETLSNSKLLKDVSKGLRLEFSKIESEINSTAVSLYDICLKNYQDSFMCNKIAHKEGQVKLNNSIMKIFEILDEDEIDYHDLENSVDVYKYKKKSLGKYQIV